MDNLFVLYFVKALFHKYYSLLKGGFGGFGFFAIISQASTPFNSFLMLGYQKRTAAKTAVLCFVCDVYSKYSIMME